MADLEKQEDETADTSLPREPETDQLEKRKSPTDSESSLSQNLQAAEASISSQRSRASPLAHVASNISYAASSVRRRKESLGKERYPEQDLDKGIVGWEGQDDPQNPRNYPASRKWTLLGFVSAIAILSPLASSVFAPAVVFMDEEFGNTSSVLSSFVVTIYVLGYAIGPMFLSPLSEIYGRRLILDIATVNFTLWQIGCALAPNLPLLIVFRLLTGIGGSGCLTIGGGVVTDLFEKEQRGFAMTLFSCGPLFGPVLGPICGGFIAQQAGWRWVFWVLLIAGGVLTTGIIIFNRETNPTILMERKTQRLRKELKRDDLHSCYEILKDGKSRTRTNIILHGIIRPTKMLICSRIVGILALYVAVIYGLLYLLFTTVSTVFKNTYHWQTDICGLAYIGLGVGLITGTITNGLTSDRIIVRMTKANNGVYEPEMRLRLSLFFACFIPISFFWYGWSVDKHVHYLVPIIGLVPFGFGMIGIFISIQTYVIDAYPQYAASGMAAVTVCRSSFGAFLPMAGPTLYDSLGYGWGNSLLGFIALALIPAPGLLHKYGGVIRKKYVVNLD